ncbi:translation initiation factor eIF-2B subunit gamma [Tachysurus ichikawai]
MKGHVQSKDKFCSLIILYPTQAGRKTVPAKCLCSSLPHETQHPRMHIKTGLLDAHLYCFKRSVVDFLVDNK